MMMGKSIYRILSMVIVAVIAVAWMSPKTQSAYIFPYVAENSAIIGKSLLASTGATTDTGPANMIKDINPSGGVFDLYISPGQYIDFDGIFFFSADDGVHGSELWMSDGTEEGTVLVKDINPDSGESFIDNLTIVSDTLFFRASDGVFGDELWKSDGTDTGTVMVKDINPSSSSSPSCLTDVNGILYFAADDGEHGIELWRSDGTEESTMMIKDINPESESSILCDPWNRYFIENNGILYFVANDGIHMDGLWKSNGTEEGTVLVEDINPSGHEYDHVSWINELNGEIFFIAYDGTSEGLWKSDGTNIGTEKVIDITVPYMEYPWLQSEGGSLFFCNEDQNNGFERWMSDGTEAGSVLIKDIYPGEGNSCSYHHFGIRYLKGKLYFSASDGLHGWEFWRTDGTESGTMLVKDINSNGDSLSGGFYQGNHIVLDELILPATDDSHGRELWKTNGSEPGTVLIQDIAFGPSSSNPQGMTVSGNKIFFFADDGVHDVELWAVPLISLSDLSIDGAGKGEIGFDYTFSAEVNPLDATTPVTYLWQATDHQGVTKIGGLSDNISFNWNTPGTKAVKVKASNLVSTLMADFTIEIQGMGSDIYLPIIVGK